MIREVSTNGRVVARWDDTTRIYTEWDEEGNDTFFRPYTGQENANADDAAAVAQADHNERIIEDKAFQGINDNRDVIDDANAFLAIDSPSNAIIAAQVRGLTEASKLSAKQRNGIIRLILRKFEDVE